MIGPVTKHAILGVIFGIIALPIWGALSGQFDLAAGLVGGFAGGLVGGTILGVGTRLSQARA